MGLRVNLGWSILILLSSRLLVGAYVLIFLSLILLVIVLFVLIEVLLFTFLRLLCFLFAYFFPSSPHMEFAS